MISLKNKIIRNFIAGILACVLIFSILVSLFVTFNYRAYLDDFEDPRPAQITTAFQRILKQPGINEKEIWDNMDEIADQLEVDIVFKKTEDEITHSYFARDPDQNPNLKRQTKHTLVNADRNRRSGTLYITYNANPEPIKGLQKNFITAILYGLSISLVIGIIISLILSDNISAPIANMSDATVKIKDGYYDIGDRQTDIIELENLQNNINYLSKNLKDQGEIRKQYAQDISHELRTPLTNLQLYIEAIRDGVIDADQNTMDILLEDVKRLDGLVEGLKKTFDNNVDYITLNYEEFDLTRLIKSVSESFAANAESKNIRISTNLKEDVIIKSDKDKVSQILQNLISNAIKAIGSDGNIDLILTEDNESVTINVMDDGIGIEADKVDRIFERFYRIDDARNTKDNGHGLGLSITKHFVEALGGKIKVESKIGEGSKFILTFIK